MSNELCSTTRGSYVISPVVIRCVHQCSHWPFGNSQSKTISGVSTTACSFNSEMVGMDNEDCGVVAVWCDRRERQMLTAESSAFEATAPGTHLIQGGTRLGLG